jgi:hypothetical protein
VLFALCKICPFWQYTRNSLHTQHTRHTNTMIMYISRQVNYNSQLLQNVVIIQSACICATFQGLLIQGGNKHISFQQCVRITALSADNTTVHWGIPIIIFQYKRMSTKIIRLINYSGIPRNFFLGKGGGGSTNSVEDRGQREWGSGGSSPLVRGSTQFANEWNPYSD